MTTDQLRALKPGDTVAYEVTRFSQSGTETHWRITTVDRVLKTQIVTKNDKRWSLKDGIEVGSQADCKPFLCAATPERVQAAADDDEKEALARRLNLVSWKMHSLDSLRRVIAIVKEPS